MLRLGVDTGGTFTDFVLCGRDGSVRMHKVLSTPDAPERAILQGIAEMGLDPARLQLVHGSTVATNAVLEGKGVRTVYVGNRGLGDLLTIGRQQRRALYDLQPAPMPPPVPRDLCLETDGRLDHSGRPIEPLGEEALAALGREIERLAPAAVAVNLLFSYLDDTAERRIAEVVPDGVFVSLSCEVLPEIREYERGMATWLNAWVGPLVAGYLRRLQVGLGRGPVSVMQSSGDTVSAAQAAGHAVRMLLSGPAGGLVAARHVGQLAGSDRLLTFDMGGTSTDVALVDGAPRLTTEGRVDRYPVAVPMVDMHTIGAGGGSIAWIDAGGLLQVGPRSAGAVPGPACYGAGGVEATVTDANLVLGRLRADAFLGGRMQLDTAAANRAVGRLASELGQSVQRTALDIVAIADEHMAQALRAISIKRGADPREHVLASFGGAGGLHVCALADLLDMPRALVPLNSGVLSALGMLVARPGRQLSHSLVGRLDGFAERELDRRFGELAAQGICALVDEGFDGDDCEVEPSVDLRYLGQSYTLNLPWTGRTASAEAFHQLHETRYGHRLDLPVELVNLRQAIRGPVPDLVLPRRPDTPHGEPFAHCRVTGCVRPVATYWRQDLAPGQRLAGPALICETVATSWVPAGWSVESDAYGNLRLRRDTGVHTSSSG